MIIRAALAPGVNAGTPPVPQDFVSSSGPGSLLVPKASILTCSGVTTLGTPVNNSRRGMGFTDGTNQRAMSSQQENGAAAGNTDAGNVFDDATVIHMANGAAPTLAGEARFDSFITGGVRLQFDDLLEDLQIAALNFFGEDIEGVAVVDFTGSASIGGTASVSGLAFAPNFVCSLSHFAAYSANGSNLDYRRSVGYGVQTLAGSIMQVAHTKFCNHQNAFLTSHASALHDDSIFSAFDQTSDGATMALTAWNSDGATFTTARAAVAPVTTFLFMRIRNANLWAGIPSLVTSSTGIQSIPIGFPVQAYLALATAHQSKNATNRAGQGNGWSHGFANDFGDQFCMGGFELDGATNGVSRSVASTKVAQVVLDPTSSAFSWSAVHSAMTQTGFDIEIDDASLLDEMCAFVAFGRKGTGWLPEVVKRRHQTQLWGPR